MSSGITPEVVEEAMIVSRDRAVELLKQAEEMKLIRLDGSLYYSTALGNAFFESFKNDDRTKLDTIFCEYPPYLRIKSILSQKSVSITELKKDTGLTEVAVEIILRLLQYVCDDFCIMNETFFLRTKELPTVETFLSILRKTYLELNTHRQWGCSKGFIRVDKIAEHVCMELRLSLGDFSRLLNDSLRSCSPIEMHSEVAGYQFLPFLRLQLSPRSFRRCYMILRDENP